MATDPKCVQKKVFQDGDELKKAARVYAKFGKDNPRRKAGVDKMAGVYGYPIGKWQIGKLEHLCGTLAGCVDFDEDINDWDVTNVERMVGTFASRHRFNKPLNKWNTHKVTTMESMFCECFDFNQSVETFNTSKVECTACMFKGATIFNHPVVGMDWSGVDELRVDSYVDMFDTALTFHREQQVPTGWDGEAAGFNKVSRYPY